MHGAKAASLVSRIEQEIKQIREEIETSLGAMKTIEESTGGMDFYRPIAGWYTKKIQSGWNFDSETSTVKDYGIAIWRDRQIEAVMAQVHILMKNRAIGEYSDDCWYAGYLVDTEFSMQREPFVAECSDENLLKDWQINHRFDTKWDLGVN